MELAELSVTPLPDALFTVPSAFHSVSMQELSASVLGSFTPPVAAKPITPVPAGTCSGLAAASRSALIAKGEPQYTEEARKAKCRQVVLTAVVGTDGSAHDLKVVKSLSPDLDQKAIEAVSQWTFRPGEKDGKPVNVMATSR